MFQVERIEDGVVERELEKWLTVSQAAEFLGISKTTVRRLSDTGDLKSYRIGTGRHRRFKKKDVIETLEGEELILS
ncbi:helix-turn-helix domain-containing protein [bacterium]|nr:helix-turn-helix domain-containing protein [bacterium]MBU1615342.1 helix-turn-helix domain-containing protein [bacterium]